MDKSLLIKRLREQREHTVDLGNGKSVKVLRPAESEFFRLTRERNIVLVGDYVTGWDGFSEADLFGAAVGSSDPLDFDADLWREIVSDNAEWIKKVSDAIGAAVESYLEGKGLIEKK